MPRLSNHLLFDQSEIETENAPEKVPLFDLSSLQIDWYFALRIHHLV